MFKDKEKAIEVLDSTVAIIGIGLISYGTYLVYKPASFIILGCILFLPKLFERSERG